MEREPTHQPVLLRETVESLAVRPGGVYVDATLGGAGHAEAILDGSAPDGRLLGLDRDPEAIRRAEQRLARFGGRFQAMHTSFSNLGGAVARWNPAGVDGVLMDLGVSSFQLDDATRGFSFRFDAPLDMRMDTTRPFTAADVVNEWPEADLADVIRRYGEEPAARRVTARIAERRRQAPIRTTLELAALVEQAVGGRRGRLHPATRTFQALRMAVNDEPGELEAGLKAGLGALKPGGRLAVLTFHSLEDRAVKLFFRRHAGQMESLQAGGARWVGEPPRVQMVTRKKVTPGPEEIRDNPRARSAGLRAAERLE